MTVSESDATDAARRAYSDAFLKEREADYLVIDAFEAAAGYKLDRLTRLEPAACVLACPLKANPPNWQHGRVLYAALRRWLADHHDGHVTVLDIGTAKGFSALCLQWALIDAQRPGQVVSVDIVGPNDRVPRNTVAELDGPKTLHEILAPWPEAAGIVFAQDSGVGWLQARPTRVHFAFVDGKHSYEAVSAEARLLGEHQMPGDMIVFDDLQIPRVAAAVNELRGYGVARVEAKADRAYAIAVKQ